METSSLVEPNSQAVAIFSDEICQAKPSKLAAPNIHHHVEDICAMKFKDVDLVDGWLGEDDTRGKPTEWKMRELDESCRSDLFEFRRALSLFGW